jgi:hypothetical protein
MEQNQVSLLLYQNENTFFFFWLKFFLLSKNTNPVKSIFYFKYCFITQCNCPLISNQTIGKIGSENWSNISSSNGKNSWKIGETKYFYRVGIGMVHKNPKLLLHVFLEPPPTLHLYFFFFTQNFFSKTILPKCKCTKQLLSSKNIKSFSKILSACSWVPWIATIGTL